MPQLDYKRIVKFGQKTTFVGLSYSLLNLIPQGPVHSGPEQGCLEKEGRPLPCSVRHHRFLIIIIGYLLFTSLDSNMTLYYRCLCKSLINSANKWLWFWLLVPKRLSLTELVIVIGFNYQIPIVCLSKYLQWSKNLNWPMKTIKLQEL